MHVPAHVDSPPATTRHTYHTPSLQLSCRGSTHNRIEDISDTQAIILHNEVRTDRSWHDCSRSEIKQMPIQPSFLPSIVRRIQITFNPSFEFSNRRVHNCKYIVAQHSHQSSKPRFATSICINKRVPETLCKCIPQVATNRHRPNTA